ncbi:MAG: DUF6273 domain-containing protein, partial [Christensenellales bacterium]
MYCNGVSISSSTATYFKLEPIVWQVLSIDEDGKALIHAVQEITAMAYYPNSSDRTIDEATVSKTNYKYSSVRAYLNNIDGSSYSVSNYTDTGFLGAFNTNQLELIQVTNVDNSTASGANSAAVCENTNDKVFLLSYNDVYGSNPYYASNALRIKYPTDY